MICETILASPFPPHHPFPKPRWPALVDRHPTGKRRLLVVHLVRVGVLLLRVWALGTEEVRLEPRAEVVHADEGVDDGQDDEHDGQDGKGRQRPPDGVVVLAVAGLVDAHQLEEEVGEAAKVGQDDEAHADLVLAAGEEGGAEEDSDGDGDGGDVEAQLDVVEAVDDDEELHGKAEEEEKVKLEQGDVDLSTLSAPRTTNRPVL